MVQSVITRWDPKSRAGAISVKGGRLDTRTMQNVSELVADWAEYQNLAGECDNVETSPITGNYDWRSYVREEAAIARRREAKKKPVMEKQAAPPPAPAPSVFYA